MEELEAIAEELTAEGLLKQPSLPRAGRLPRKRQLPRVQVGGYSIIYGRSGLQNDEVLRQADGDDIWLHVRYGPGGHVIIRSGGNPQAVPAEVVEAAASHAAALSKQRNQDLVEVAYTLAKHVRKPKGAPPGFAYYTDFKTISVPPRRLDE